MRYSEKENLKNLIGETKIRDVIEVLKEHVNSNTDRDLFNDLINIQSQYTNIDKLRMNGTAQLDEIIKQHNKVSKSLLSFIDSIPSDNDFLSDKNTSPKIKWVGGHFSEDSKPIPEFIEEHYPDSSYLTLIKKLESEIKQAISLLDLEDIWISHLEGITKYLGNFIPDEIKEVFLDDSDLACLYISGLRSVEIQISKSDSSNSKKLYDIIQDNSVGYEALLLNINPLVQAIKDNKDSLYVVAHSIENRKLNFIFACVKFIGRLDYILNRFPEKSYKDIAPNSKFLDPEIHRENFNIHKIDLNYNTHEVGIQATCNSAIIHQVLATLIDYLNQELNSINILFEPFHISILRVKLRVETTGYEGKHHEFTTQMSTVISMFMGEELYGDSRVFIRELLQNARDAVLTRLAIKQHNNLPFTPKIEFVFNEEEGYLICRDNGIGMDEYIIKKYLSDVGRSFYTSEDYKNLLENENKEQYSPISRFGIGLLSCFLVADKIVIRTRKESERVKGYRVDIPRRGAFFFLREDKDIDFFGTEVKLELSKTSLSDNAKWLTQQAKIRTYYTDPGILFRIKDSYKVSTEFKEYKKFLVENGKWKLPRLVSMYAHNVDVDIDVTHGKDKTRISKFRLLRHFSDMANNHKIKFKNDFIRAVIYKKADALYYDNNKKMLSSGGIYVPSIRDFSLNKIGLPEWNSYNVDIHPSRVRMNLARNKGLDFYINESERQKIWNAVFPDIKKHIDSIDINSKHDYILNKSNNSQKYNNRVFEEVKLFPDEGKKNADELLKNRYYVFTFKIIDSEFYTRKYLLRNLLNMNVLELHDFSHSSIFKIINSSKIYVINHSLGDILSFLNQNIELVSCEDRDSIGGYRQKDDDEYEELKDAYLQSVKNLHKVHDIFYDTIFTTAKEGTWVKVKNSGVIKGKMHELQHEHKNALTNLREYD